MEIQVNKKLICIPYDYTLGMLLEQMGFSMSVAIFINSNQIFFRDYQNFKINEKDSIRIIRPLAGG